MEGIKNLDDAYEYWPRAHPFLWSQCYPKVYQVKGDNFVSPKYVALNLLAAVLWFSEERDTCPVPSIHAAYAAETMFPYMVPSYFIDRQFFIALSGTELPRDLRWTDVPLPYEAGVIYLPAGVMQDPEGDDVSALTWCRKRKAETLSIQRQFSVEFSEDVFVVVVMGEPVHQRTYSIAIHADETPYMVAPEINVPVGRQEIYDLPITESDDAFLRQAAVLCMNILMSVQYRPQFVSPEQRVPGQKTKKGKGGRDIWSPNYVGRGYRIRTDHLGGTHASPRMHWRPAHWVHQAVGNIKNNPDFIYMKDLPRDDEGRIDWPNVADDVKDKFWKCHRLTLIDEPVLVRGS